MESTKTRRTTGIGIEVHRSKALPRVSNTVNSQGHLTCAEYFAGIGLVRLGLEQAGWNVVFANDWAHHKFEMYTAHFKDADKYYKIQDIFPFVLLIFLAQSWQQHHFPVLIYLWQAI